MWQRRKYDAAGDRNAILYLWLMSHAYSPYGERAGLVVPKQVPDDDGVERTRWVRDAAAFDRYWKRHAPIVDLLTREFDVDVLCDVEDQGTIIAFACQGDRVVHMAVRKRRFKDYSSEIFAALLGHHGEGVTYTHEMPDVMRLHRGRMPVDWRYDEFWLTRWVMR